MKATKDNWEYGVYNQFDKKYGTLDESTKDVYKRQVRSGLRSDSFSM